MASRIFVGHPATGPVTHSTTGALTGPGSVVAGSAARSGSATTHDTSGALVGPGSTVAGTSAGTLHAVTQPSGGISHGKKPRKPEIAVITVDGQDYRVPIDQVQAFLDRMREQVVEPEQAIAKVEKKKAKAPKKAYEPPVIVVKSAPPDVMQMISARVDRSNEIIRKMWEGTILRRIREMEIDDEEAIILLLAA